ncbi:MAG: hypothetical protein JKY23_00395 [Nitrospinaceae bacterium]|nr:hypothetical protein [Nitrospinaceae bacterium]
METDDIGQQHNLGRLRVAHTYNVILNKKNAYPATEDMGPNQLVFCYRHKTCDKFTPGFTQFRSVSAMNKYMISSQGRRHYGNAKFASVVMEDWAFLGCQQTDTNRYTNQMDAAVTVHVAHRCRTPNIWLINGNVGQGDLLWLLLRRKEFASDTQSGLDSMRINSMTGVQEGKQREVKSQNSYAAVAMGVAQPATPTPDLYWVYEPFVTRKNEAPPHQLLGSVGEGWFGAPLLVGTASDLYGQPDPSRYRAAALQAVFPKSKSFKEPLYRLPEVEVMLGVK